MKVSITVKRRPMERTGGPVAKRSTRPASKDKPAGEKSKPVPAAAIERAINKVRQARQLVTGEAWDLLYEAEEALNRARNGSNL